MQHEEILCEAAKLIEGAKLSRGLMERFTRRAQQRCERGGS